MDIEIPDNEKDLRAGFIHLAQRVYQLEETLRLMRRGRFGPSSEKLLHPGMRPLFPEILEAEKPAEPKKTPVKAHDRVQKPRCYPEDLPREEIIIDLSESEKACSCCNDVMRHISDKVSEKLHIKPAEFVVRKFVRPVYSCKKCEAMKSAKMPYHPIPKASVTIETLAHIVVAKYIDGMPLYRVEQQCQRHGIEISRENMARWVCALGEKLLPVKEALHKRLLDGRFVAMDETTFQVNKEKGREAHQKSDMLVQGREGPPGQSIAVFHYEPSRASAVLVRYLEGFQGHFITDGLDVYRHLTETSRGIVHGGCWSHGRRKFIEQAKGQKHPKSGTALEMVNLIKELFVIEDRGKTLTIEELGKIRDLESRPVIAKIEALLNNKIGSVPAKSTTGKALAYLSNQWKNLTRFLDHPELPIHNNFIERSIRPFAVQWHSLKLFALRLFALGPLFFGQAHLSGGDESIYFEVFLKFAGTHDLVLSSEILVKMPSIIL